jgi:hypothetical protein
VLVLTKVAFASLGRLEAMCGKIGKVRRVKFYKDDHGGLKVRCCSKRKSNGGMSDDCFTTNRATQWSRSIHTPRCCDPLSG